MRVEDKCVESSLRWRSKQLPPTTPAFAVSEFHSVADPFTQLGLAVNCNGHGYARVENKEAKTNRERERIRGEGADTGVDSTRYATTSLSTIYESVAN